MQGNTTGQIMVPRPSASPQDLPIYRRAAINAEGCVAGIKVRGRWVHVWCVGGPSWSKLVKAGQR